MKKFGIGILAVAMGVMLGSGVRAQNGFNIPFSQFGIGTGELPFAMPSSMRMGGVMFSRASRNTINPFNPASYAAVEKESFVLDIGVNIQTSVLRDGQASQSDADGNLAYLMMAFPLTDWWKTSVGLLPFSTVNYESVQTRFDALTLSDVKTIYSGTGGVSQLYWGNGFNVGKRLSLGFNINYLYGSVQRAISYSFQGNDTTYCVNSRRQKDTYVSNMVLDFGAQYVQPLGEKYTMLLGVSCRAPRTMDVDDKAIVYTYHKAGQMEYLFDTIFPHRGESNTYQSTLEQPLQIGVGLALERNDRWQVAVDAFYSPYGNMQYVENKETEYNIFGNSAIRYDVPNYRLAMGFEWKGDLSASSYWRRIGVSAGMHYEGGRQAVEVGEQGYALNQIGGGLGFTLPMRKGKSLLTISMGYTSFGTVDLLRRDVLTFGLGVGSCERWFQKKKYN